MSPPLRHPTSTVLSLALGAAVPLAGCSRIVPNGEASTMTLLRDGSAKTCTAADVQQTLHNLILPTPTDPAANDEDRRAAVAGIALSYDNTTLQGFDKAVSKASCNTTVRIAGANGASNTFDVDYQISPSAENPNTFIVSARDADATAYAGQLVEAAMRQATVERETRQQQADAQQAKAKLLAVITPKWLTGTWIGIGKDAANCSDERALAFGGNRTFSSQGHQGRWALNGDQLHFVGSGPTGAIDDTSIITQADAVSFTMTDSDGTSSSFRRCSPAEVGEPYSEATVSASDLNLTTPQ